MNANVTLYQPRERLIPPSCIPEQVQLGTSLSCTNALDASFLQYNVLSLSFPSAYLFTVIISPQPITIFSSRSRISQGYTFQHCLEA